MTPKLSIESPGRRRRRGFSLVEVVVAVGIFAIAIVSVIGIVAAVGRSVSDVADADDATRLVANLQSRLQSVSFSTIQGYIGPVSAKSASARIYASRDGTKLGLGNASSVWNPPPTSLSTAEQDAQKYFLVEILRNTTLSPDTTFDGTSGYLAVTVRLIYPAYLGDGTQVTDSTQQNVLVVPVAITR